MVLRLGIDVGGTNTDAVILRDREVLAGVKRSTTEDVMSGMAGLFTASLFISAFGYTISRLSLHCTPAARALCDALSARASRVPAACDADLTMRGSSLCDCCPGCCRSFMLGFLKKGGPVSLNSLMIISTRHPRSPPLPPRAAF